MSSSPEASGYQLRSLTESKYSRSEPLASRATTCKRPVSESAAFTLSRLAETVFVSAALAAAPVKASEESPNATLAPTAVVTCVRLESALTSIVCAAAKLAFERLAVMVLSMSATATRAPKEAERPDPVGAVESPKPVPPVTCVSPLQAA